MTRLNNTETGVGQAVAELERQLASALAERDELLQQQAASAEILRVINTSPGDLAPVFDIILEKAHSLCNAPCGSLQLYDGDLVRAVAVRGMTDAFEKFLRQGFQVTDLFRRNLDPDHVIRNLDLAELLERTPDEPSLRAAVELGGIRTMVAVPLVSDGVVLGRIVAARQEVRPFSDNQIALLQSFAAQAVVAIENARLFNETGQALERQTATAEILKVIASSPDDVQPVLEAVADRAMSLLNCWSVFVALFDGEQMHFGAARGALPDTEEYLRKLFPARPDPETNQGRCILQRAAISAPDLQADPSSRNRDRARMRGFRAGLVVPMLRDGQPIGTISVSRKEAGAFAANEVELLQTFADQAVIAIENVRLFNETREALQQQTATADILKVIASSPADVQPVFQAIAERSNRLVNGLSTTVLTIAGETVNLSAFTKTSPAADAALAGSFPRQLSEQPWGQPNLRGEIYRVPDTEAEPSLRDLARLRGYRSMLFVPLLQNGVPIGMIGQTRAEPGSFAENHVQLLKTFADQAVIAISNVRLFQQVQERTRELSASLDNLRTAQDRLVQTEKLASLGQLTAGIAHEIKNPLNFVNNFSALSAELIDELDEALAPAALDQTTRNNVGELTQMLKSNLEKVVQHGKRADSIVKNMLLHSREGSGEHRVADINAIVDESLNLAYHGARAERSGFNIALRRELDPEAGMVELYPQEITRVLLNLISNGFYAATKRKEAGDGNFEPMLSATTKGFGNRVEIRIRDNGTGIPLEVKEKMFNPFFTTKPAGEGTGLGLSMSHDIVVKQHGGKIDVDTVAGVFTEFIITLPRNAAARPITGGTH